jgi:predicted dehydrogenase
MRILIIGLGSIGRRHLNNFKALGESDFVLLRSHQSTLPDDDLAGLPIETDLEVALKHRPDAAVIATPTALHLDTAIPLAKAGCHLLLEKPISHNSNRIPELSQAVTENGVQVLVGFQFRYHPGLQAVQSWLADGRLGTPISAQAHWGDYLPDWHPWEDYRQGYAARPDLGGGVIRTLCHPFDYLRMLFGEAAVTSCQTSSAGLNLPVEDTADVGLRFDSGTQVQVHLDYLRRPGKHTLEITGTHGSITWDNADGVARLYQADTNHRTESARHADFDRNDLFLAESRDFLHAIQHGTEPRCTLEDGIRTLEICEEALAQAALNVKR